MERAKLTQEILDNIFVLYREVTHSHAPRALLPEVLAVLESKGRFEWRSGPADRWSSKLVISVRGPAELAVKFVGNPALARPMLESLEKMRQEFEIKLTKLGL